MKTGRTPRSPQRSPHPAGQLRPLALALACMGAAPAWGQLILPTGFPQVGTVQRGTVTLANGYTATHVQLNQGTQRAVVDWNSFSLAQGNTLQINQPGAGSVMLNRVVGSGGVLEQSAINGTLSANGHVFVVNPMGVVFGPSARVNVGGLVASTLDIANDSLAPADRLDTPLGTGDVFRFTRYYDEGNNPVAVQSGAEITTPAGGTVALIGLRVDNQGTINAASGSLGLLSGRVVTLTYDPVGDGLTTFKISGDAADIASTASVVNAGTLQADGGKVELAALSSKINETLINQSGVIRARTLESKNGSIVLSAEGGASGSRVLASGTLDASGSSTADAGGTVDLRAQNLLLDNATVNANGASGGRVQLSGTQLAASSNTVRITANATAANGSGGRIDMHGTGSGDLIIASSLEARGMGSGAGGMINTHGSAVQVRDGTQVDAGGGAQGGANGQWTIASEWDLSVMSAASLATYSGRAISLVAAEALGAALSRGTDVTLSSEAISQATAQSFPQTAAELATKFSGFGVLFQDGAHVVVDGARASSLTVNSDGGVAMVNASIRSKQAALQVTFNADAHGAAAGTQAGEPLVGDAPLHLDRQANQFKFSPIVMSDSSIETAGGDVSFHGQSSADGFAIGVTKFAGVGLSNSTVSTCAAGAASCTTGGSIRMRGAGATDQAYDPNVNKALSAVGVHFENTTLRTGSGNIDIDGRGGLGAAGVLVSNTYLSNAPIESTTGSITMTGSSRVGTDTLLGFGTPGAGIAANSYGSGSGVSIDSTAILTGGNVSISGTGGDNTSGMLNSNASKRSVMNGQSSADFWAGDGVSLNNTRVVAGQGKEINITGSGSSTGTGSYYRLTYDSTTDTVTEGPPSSASGVQMSTNSAHEAITAESGTVTINGGGHDVRVIKGTSKEDGPGSYHALISTDSQTGAGGTIRIAGRNVLVDGIDGVYGLAGLSSSGATGGGMVSIQATQDANGVGGMVALGRNTLLHANATGTGHGGRVEVLADLGLRAHGMAQVRGGANGGNGGSIETSAPAFDLGGFRVDASAAAGQAGTWTIDPVNINIESGAAGSGSLPSNPFEPLTNSTVFDGDINAALNSGTSVTISTANPAGTGGNGDININAAHIAYDTANGPLNFTLNAYGSINMDSSSVIASSNSGGPLNVFFNADVNKTAAPGVDTRGGAITLNGRIYTNGGSVSMNASAGTPTFNALMHSVRLAEALIDTRAGNALVSQPPFVPPPEYTGGSDSQPGGAVTIVGHQYGANATFSSIDIAGTNILSSTGDINISGTSAGGGGVLIQSWGAMSPSQLSTTSGNISVVGVGGTGTEANSYGVALLSHTPTYGIPPSPQVGLISSSGNITVNGHHQGIADRYAGVYMGASTLIRTGGAGRVEVTGSSAGQRPGVELAPDESTFNVLPAARIEGGGTVVVRASSDSSTPALMLGAGSTISATHAINLRPGAVTATGSAVNANDTPIVVGEATTGVGFSVSNDMLAHLSAPNIVLGSDTHAADITVVGAVSTAGNLTLQNEGSGQANIDLQAPVTAHHLGLLAGGNVTQSSAGAITAGSLLARAGSGSVTLDVASNNVSANTLAGSAAARFAYQDVDTVRIGGVSVEGFSGLSNVTQTVSASGITADSIFARALTQDLLLDAPLHGVSNTTLVAGRAFQNLQPGGASAINGGPWQIWATTWEGESRGAMTGSGTYANYYNCTYAGACGVSIETGGNHFIYAAQPELVVHIADATRQVDQPNPPLHYDLSGLILGDSNPGLLGTLSTTATASSPAGRYAIDGNFADATAQGYAVRVLPGEMRVLPGEMPVLPGETKVTNELPPAMEWLREPLNTYTFDQNIGPVSLCLAPQQQAGTRLVEGSDPVAQEWPRVRSRPNLSNCVDTAQKNGCSDF